MGNGNQPRQVRGQHLNRQVLCDNIILENEHNTRFYSRCW